LREGDHLEEAGVVGRIILKLILEMWEGGMYWIDVTRDKDR
jgi:hypothetical protein